MTQLKEKCLANAAAVSSPGPNEHLQRSVFRAPVAHTGHTLFTYLALAIQYAQSKRSFFPGGPGEPKQDGPYPQQGRGSAPPHSLKTGGLHPLDPQTPWGMEGKDLHGYIG